MVVVGKNPYPQGATGIPFIKPCWEEMRDTNCSGRYVLESLTGLTIEEIEKLSPSPREFAFQLLEQAGVVLLNAAYSKGPWRAKYRRESWENSNHKVIAHAANKGAQVLLCGQARVIESWVKKENLWPSCAPHPSLQSRASLTRTKSEDIWDSCWTRGSLKEAFDLPDFF